MSNTEIAQSIVERLASFGATDAVEIASLVLRMVSETPRNDATPADAVEDDGLFAHDAMADAVRRR